jgi:alpha-galactosidase
MGLPPLSAWVAPGRPIEGPHAFLGVTPDTPGAELAAITAFVRAGRAHREFPAATTFNTWFVHGINIDERSARRDIDMASEAGVEVFQLDAGWYPREQPRHAFDFTSGLGSWEVDGERFPAGLAALADYAHEHGMKFGLWVEPERVALSTVGRPGLADEAFLAHQDGAYEPGVPNEEATDAQVCLASPEARAWLLRRLTTLIEGAHLDNLKWDFNRWVRCARAGHGHPVDGGNYEHTRGLYELLAALRQRFPHLTVENCSGGGHRLDFALARLTDAGWMDDRSAPSAHVRRNLQGLMTAFPASYLFSYVMPHVDEPMHGSNDVAMIVRSRMPGVVGLATDLFELSEAERNEVHQQFALAKSLRDRDVAAVTHVLTPQRPGPGEWEVVQQFLPSTGGSIVFAFAAGAERSTVVALRTALRRSRRHRPFARQRSDHQRTRNRTRGRVRRTGAVP